MARFGVSEPRGETWPQVCFERRRRKGDGRIRITSRNRVRQKRQLKDSVSGAQYFGLGEGTRPGSTTGISAGFCVPDKKTC